MNMKEAIPKQRNTNQPWGRGGGGAGLPEHGRFLRVDYTDE